MLQKQQQSMLAGNRMEAICFRDAQEFAERCEKIMVKCPLHFTLESIIRGKDKFRL